MSKISEEDAEMLAHKFAVKLQQSRSVSDSEHFDHHQWITEKIRHERARREFWEKMQEHIAKWGMVSVVSFAFYALWLGIKAVFKLNGLH